MKSLSKIILGVCLVIAGVLYGLDKLNVIKFDIFFKGWWTLFIIVPCFIGFIRGKERIGNVIGMIVGVFILLGTNGISAWKLFVPVLLIGIGITFIFPKKADKEVDEEIERMKSSSKNSHRCLAVFSGQEFSAENGFEGCELTAVFGGIKCDLSSHVFTHDVLIDTVAIFGGVDITVPKGVTVKTRSFCLFGGIDDERKTISSTAQTQEFFEDGSAQTHTPVVYVNAFCLFGGANINDELKKK